MSTPNSKKALIIKLGPSPNLDREIRIYKELGANVVGGPASIPQIIWEELGYQGIIMPKYHDDLRALEHFVYVSICAVDTVYFKSNYSYFRVR